MLSFLTLLALLANQHQVGIREGNLVRLQTLQAVGVYHAVVYGFFYVAIVRIITAG